MQTNEQCCRRRCRRRSKRIELFNLKPASPLNTYDVIALMQSNAQSKLKWIFFEALKKCHLRCS